MSNDQQVDFAAIRGQPLAKRIMEIAAAGRHNVLIVGAPSSNKTMLARRVPGIMPPMTFQESVGTTYNFLSARMLQEEALLTDRTFRAPHHTCSLAAIAGIGPRPGETALAHNGVLFVDELSEWRKETLEGIFAGYPATYLRQFLLIAAMNPCPCGYHGVVESTHRCDCTQEMIARYWSRIPKWFLNQIDLVIELPLINLFDTAHAPKGESSATIQARVMAAWEVQKTRNYHGTMRINSRLDDDDRKQWCKLSSDCSALMDQAIARLGLDAHAQARTVNVARTIADLEGADNIRPVHLSEALQYRIEASTRSAFNAAKGV